MNVFILNSYNFLLKMTTRQCLLILGMHRSGTSALSGALYVSGVEFGRSIAKPSFDNPKGFFENEKIVAFNERLLKILNTRWDRLSMLPEQWWLSSAVTSLLPDAKEIIRREFLNVLHFAIKDPRLCLTFPFWKQVLIELEIEPSCVIILRNPSEIAASLEQRNYFSKNKSYLLTTTHLLLSEYYSRTLSRTIITYDQLLDKPFDTIQHIIDHLTIPNVRVDVSTLNEYLNQGLRNHLSKNNIEKTQKERKLLPAYMQEIYPLLMKAMGTEKMDSTLYTQLDTFRLTYAQYAPSYLKELAGPTEYFIKLLIDTGNGYTEKETRRTRIATNNFRWNLDLTDLEKSIEGCKFILTNVLCRIEIKQLHFAFEEAATTYELSDNAILQENQILHFDTDFPQLIIQFKKPVKIKSLFIELNYLELGGIDTKSTLVITNSNNRPLQLLRTILKHPLRLLRSINKKNYRILRSALRRESPQEILKNLLKLLRRPDNQKLIEQEQSARRKRGVLMNQESNIPATTLKLLYIAPQLPEYDTSSGGKRATRLLALLSESFEVIVYSTGTKKKKYAERLQQMGITVIDTDHYRRIKREYPQIDILLYGWYYTLLDAKRFITLYPNARVIMDTVDIHWIREERSIGIKEGLTAKRVKKNKRNEIDAYKQADIIWAVTEQDRQAVLQEIPIADVRVVSNIHEPITREYKDSGNNNILFIGDYNHYPNISAIQFLALNILPTVRLTITDAELTIAGANAPMEVKQLAKQPGVVYKGYIAEEEMDDLYKNTFLMVAPLLAGAGIKGKICESIAYRIPVVTNLIGNEGIDLIHEEEGLIVKAEEMPIAIIKAMRRDYDFGTMTSKAQEKLFQLVGPNVVQSAMLNTIFPEVSVCIVTWNKVDLLKKCIDSIEVNTTYPNYKILVHSNACTDGTKLYLENAAKNNKRIIPFFSTENEVFVRPNNKMMQFFPENDIVLLNNDTFVAKNWLIELHRTAYSSKDFGVVGAKILYPNGDLQEFGAELYADGTGRNIGKGDDPNLKYYNKTKEVGYVSGCAMFIKRNTIEKIGLLDEQFHPCYCEDSDYCYTAKEQGLKTVVTPHSIVYHEEGGTAGTDEATGFKQYQAINMKKFLAKHQGILR